MALSSIFIGAPQSKYAAMAILGAVIIVSLTLLFGKDPIPFTQKLAFVLMLFLLSLPGILLTLFQMTCIVTGAGFRNQRPWCGWYAWIVTALLILYCALLIIVAVTSLVSGEKMIDEFKQQEQENFEDVMKFANTAAKQLLEEKKPVIEKFEDVKEEAEEFKLAAKKASGGAPEEKPKLPPASVPEPFEDLEPFNVCAPY